MKPFKHFPYKWALTGTLLASLGASMSFNPESKYVARNEFKTQGQYAMALTNDPSNAKPGTPAGPPPIDSSLPGSPSAPPAADPNLAQEATASAATGTPAKPVAPPAAKGADVVATPGASTPTSQSLTISIDAFTEVKGVWDIADGKVLYSIQKKEGASADGADYCLKCVTDLSIKSLDLKNSGLTDAMAIQLFVKADAQKQIAKLDKDSDDDGLPSKPEKADIFEVKVSCTGYGVGKNTDFSGLLACQQRGLEKAINACHAKIDKQQEEGPRRESRRAPRLSSYSDDSTQYRSCDRAALSYARTKMEPAIKAALSKADFHDDAIAAIEALTGNDGLLDGAAGEEQLQQLFAKDLVAGDAKQELNEIRSQDFLEEARQFCGVGSGLGFNSMMGTRGGMNMNTGINNLNNNSMAGANSAGNVCVQTLSNITGYNGYVNNINSDLAELSGDGFNVAAVNVVRSLGIVAVPPTGVDFASTLQNLANGYAASGNNNISNMMVDNSGRTLDTRWANGVPVPGATSGVNSIGQQNVNNPNVRGTTPQNVPAQNFPTMSGTGQSTIIVK